LNSSNNLTGVFHMLIIAIFLLSLNACGYKAPPYYIGDAPSEDENVKFILQDMPNGKTNNDANVSCED